MSDVDPVLENARLATACGAEPAMALAVALASAGPRSAAELFALLDDKRADLLRALTPADADDAADALRTMPSLEPELRYEPELARMRLDVGDHEVRGRLLFGELLGKKSFWQVAALEIGGVELGEEDAELLGHCGVLTQLADVRVWPLTVVRRIAARGGGLAASVVGGMATLINRRMAVLPVAGFMRTLDAIEASVGAGCTVEQAVDALLARRERIPGVGRPVLGNDERVAPKLALFARYGRAEGASVRLAREIDTVVADRKGLGVNSAGYQAALLRDLGFSPSAAAAFCLLYFAVPVVAHAVFAEERGLSTAAAAEGEGRTAAADETSRISG